MKLKLNDAGLAFVQDGKPVYVADDGKEIPFDVTGTLGTISRLNGEAKGHREAKEAAEKSLKTFEGIDDADFARKAVETVKNLDQNQLFTAGKVEEIKAAAKKAAEDQVAAAAKASQATINELAAERDGLKTSLFTEKVGGAFSRSKFIADKIAVPSDLIQNTFGQRFKIENGKVVGVGVDGQPIYSRTKAGEIADFDEALESMVDAYPHRDAIIKWTGGTGGGARANSGSNGGGSAKTITRAAFEALGATERHAKIMKEGVTVVDG
jgi:hypothetical protein